MALSMQEEDPWLSAKELSKLFPLSAHTFLRMMHKGEIESVHAGRCWFARLSAFTAWLDRQTIYRFTERRKQEDERKGA